MTIKKQFEILEKISKEYEPYYGLNSGRRINTMIKFICELENNLGNKIYLGEYKGNKRNGYYFELNYSLMVLRKFIDIKEEGNDAPRGGQQGNYLIIKDSKKNKEILEFIKSILMQLN